VSDGGDTPAGEDGPDPGLQAERTELAWVRTALSCGGLALIATHLADDRLTFAVAALVGALVALPGLAGAGLRVGALRGGAGRAGWTAPQPASRAAVQLLVVTVVLADLVALVALLR
jgi:uncharacterized membrane protein YidH (DUF202 family)